MVGRSLKIALVLAPLVISGYLVGLPYGPKGVACAYSVVMTLWVVPHLAWCVRGTVISLRDILVVVSKPLVSGAVAMALAFTMQLWYGDMLRPLPRLLLGSTIMVVAYIGMLFYVMGQKRLYLDLIQGLRKRSSAELPSLARA